MNTPGDKPERYFMSGAIKNFFQSIKARAEQARQDRAERRTQSSSPSVFGGAASSSSSTTAAASQPIVPRQVDLQDYSSEALRAKYPYRDNWNMYEYPAGDDKITYIRKAGAEGPEFTMIEKPDGTRILHDYSAGEAPTRTTVDPNGRVLSCILGEEVLYQVPQRAGMYLDGTIEGDMKQGQTGDCWLLSSIQAIRTNPETAELLNDCISIDNDGNAVVNLRGAGTTYTITQKEIADSLALSEGDPDIRAIEIAMGRYCKDNPNWVDRLKSTVIGGLVDRFLPTSGTSQGASRELTGNLSSRALDVLIPGGRAETPILMSTIARRAQDPNYIVTATANLTADRQRTRILDMDGNPLPRQQFPSHVYAVTGADDKYVYLQNPHDSSIPLKIEIKHYKEIFMITHSKAIN
jgi:hypothetical protein